MNEKERDFFNFYFSQEAIHFPTEDYLVEGSFDYQGQPGPDGPTGPDGQTVEEERCSEQGTKCIDIDLCSDEGISRFFYISNFV